MGVDLFKSLGLALVLGLLVGLQREWRATRIAGIRTFSLLSIMGALAGSLMDRAGSWLIFGGLISVASLLVVGNVMAPDPDDNAGITTEVAALVMYLVGVSTGLGFYELAVVVGGVTAVLLQWKEPLHMLVGRIGNADLQAIMKFALIALVVLPLLPDETYGPYEVLNPYEVWLMVVLIVGLSLGAYAGYRAVGNRAGNLIGGVLGGLISSTATTVTFARNCRSNPASLWSATLVILLASTIVNIRILMEIGVAGPLLLRSAAPPFLILTVFMSIICGVVFWRARGSQPTLPQHENPAQLRTALIFGALYAVIIFAVAAVKANFGNRGLFVVAFISGLTDVDAMTLSVAQLVQGERIDPTTGWRAVLVAMLSNLFFKAMLAGSLGGRRLFLAVGAVFGLTMACGIALLFLW